MWLGGGGRASLKVTPRGLNKTQEKLKAPVSVCPGGQSLPGWDRGQSCSPAAHPPLTPQTPFSNTLHGTREAKALHGSGSGLEALATLSRSPPCPPPPAQPCPWQLSPSIPAGTWLRAGPVVASCRGRWAEVTQESESLGLHESQDLCGRESGASDFLCLQQLHGPRRPWGPALCNGFPGLALSAAATLTRNGERGLCLWAPDPR